jgi:hypothetical protein
MLPHRSYASATNQQEAALQARADLPFLFKAFETGQIGPKRMAKMHGGKPRMATIHEYLDWTLTAQAAQEDDELVSTPEDICSHPSCNSCAGDCSNIQAWHAPGYMLLLLGQGPEPLLRNQDAGRVELS